MFPSFISTSYVTRAFARLDFLYVIFVLRFCNIIHRFIDHLKYITLHVSTVGDRLCKIMFHNGPQLSLFYSLSICVNVPINSFIGILNINLVSPYIYTFWIILLQLCFIWYDDMPLNIYVASRWIYGNAESIILPQIVRNKNCCLTPSDKLYVSHFFPHIQFHYKIQFFLKIVILCIFLIKFW